MSKTFTLRRTLSAGLAAFAALAFTAACGDDAGDSGHDMDSESATGAEFNDADVTFAQMMIPHHEQAVDMAALAQEHATDPELIGMADQISAAQQPEIDTMTGWLEAWSEPVEMEGHEGMSMGGMASEDQMVELAAAHGAEFDRLFAELMIAHHEGAVEMAETEQADGQHQDAVTMAGTIIDAQTAEIAALQGVLERL